MSRKCWKAEFSSDVSVVVDSSRSTSAWTTRHNSILASNCPLTRHMTTPYQDQLSGEAVVLGPVQILQGVLSLCCSKLHQAAQGALLRQNRYKLGQTKGEFHLLSAVTFTGKQRSRRKVGSDFRALSHQCNRTHTDELASLETRPSTSSHDFI